MKNAASFGHVLAPLMRPMYTLQMAKSKEWSKQAKRKHLIRFIIACDDAKSRAEMELRILNHQSGKGGS